MNETGKVSAIVKYRTSVSVVQYLELYRTCLY